MYCAFFPVDGNRACMIMMMVMSFIIFLREINLRTYSFFDLGRVILITGLSIHSSYYWTIQLLSFTSYMLVESLSARRIDILTFVLKSFGSFTLISENITTKKFQIIQQFDTLKIDFIYLNFDKTSTTDR